MIINVDSQLKEVNRHPWVIAGGKGEMDLEDPMMEVCLLMMMTMMAIIMIMRTMRRMIVMVVMKIMSSQVVQTHIIPSDDTIDADVIQV